LVSIANQGILAVGVDNFGHGERRFHDFDDRFSCYNPNFDFELFSAVRSSASEVPGIIDSLIGAFDVNPGKIGICGISMGGHIAYKALLNDRRIKVAVPIIGSPVWKAFYEESPALFIDKFYPCALLSQTAGADDIVPPNDTRAFHEKLKKYYSKKPHMQNYVEFAGAGHMLPEKDWNVLWENLLNWFEEHLVK